MPRGFSPVIDARTRILILGSFPGQASLDAQEYYAHPRNLFWKIVGEVIGEDLPSMHYQRRCATLLAHNIGLWDVYAHCEREGSLDNDITNASVNDFAQLTTLAPHLQRICYNGQRAARHPINGYEHVVLPSTSPANASVPYARKLAQWRDALRQ